MDLRLGFDCEFCDDGFVVQSFLGNAITREEIYIGTFPFLLMLSL